MSAVATLPLDHQIGANGPPDTYGAHAAHIDDLYTEAANWCDGADIENAAQAAEVNRLIDDFKDAITAAEASRDAAKKPHADKVNEIQTQYYPLIGETKAITGKAIRAKAALLAVKTKWANKVAAEQKVIADALRKEAEDKAAAAVLAARQSHGDLQAAEEVEELFHDAQQAARTANAAEKVTVKGMRDNWVVKGFQAVTDEAGEVTSGPVAMLRYYFKTRQSDLIEACLELAKAEVRAGKRAIPGLQIENDRRAV